MIGELVSLYRLGMWLMGQSADVMECHCDWGVGQSVPLEDVVDGSVS